MPGDRHKSGATITRPISAIAASLYLQVFDLQGVSPWVQVTAGALNAIGMVMLIAYIVAVAA